MMKKAEFELLVKLIHDYVAIHPCMEDCKHLGCPRKNILGLADALQKSLLRGELPDGF